MKDNRVYILPLISVILVAVVLLRPDITGLIVGGGIQGETIKHLSGKIKITISKDIIPKDSVITVFLNNQSSSMPIREFIDKTGEEYEFRYGRIPEIGYEGYGYAGKHSYTLNLSEFGLDLNLKPGNYTLVTEISYENFVISTTAEEIIV